MKYFEKFVSNTVAGSGNQKFFNLEDGEVKCGRVFYKITVGGEFNYSLLFSNIMDSTFADGSESHKNLICNSWQIHSAKVYKCVKFNEDKDVLEMTMTDGADGDIVVLPFCELTFNSKKEKTVMPGEFFSSDPVTLSFDKGDYLCLEIEFSGRKLPYHEESIIPVFVKEDGVWKYSKQMPFAGMIGIDRQVKARIAYFGDSITQGIGTPINSYSHWNAVLSEKIGNEYSFWNIGLGYGRANDAASDGAWLYKAKQSDIVFVCFGVNDIIQGLEEEQIKKDLKTIVQILKNEGKTVIMQTIPPFDYTGGHIDEWKRINAYIKEELAPMVDMLFDNSSVLSVSKDEAHITKYGGHPDSEGCRIWGEALYDAVKDMF